MAKSTFGERLRREREMRGVGLEEIAAATRISTRFLEALENEQWERLPGGVFNRGFIRAVSRFLGLDEESLLAEYAMATDDRPEVAVWATAPPKPRRSILPWVVVLLVIALGVGGWFGYQKYGSLITAWRAPLPSAPAPTPAPPVAPAIAKAATPEAPRPAKPGELETLELKVEAGRYTTLKVLADGRIVFDGGINAGQTHRFQAKEKFEVSAGNSAALLLELNGQTAPPLGPPGEPGSLTLTRKDLKKPQGGPD